MDLAANKHSEAYDLSLFEPDQKRTVKREKNPKNQMNESNLIRLHPGSITKAQRRKRNPVAILGVAVLTILVASVCATIVQSNVVLNELNEQIVSANATIVKQQNMAAQYQLKVDSKLSGNVVQKYAEENLGMIQAKNAQKRFISLSSGDEAIVLREDESNNPIETVANAFKGLWS